MRFISLCLLLTLPVQVMPLSAQEAGLQQTLETSYQRWRGAMLRQDARGWAANITMYRQVTMRNLIVSQRQHFPEAVFAVPLQPPDLAGLRLLEAQAVGDTAHLLYFGRVNMGGDLAEVPHNMLMLKFFRENGYWRYDSSRMINLEGSPDVREKLLKGGPPDFLDEPEFTPPGTPPSVPPLCEKPEHMAGCTIQAFGYEARMKINGFDYPAVQDNAEKMFVIGGLKNGTNEVQIEIKAAEIAEKAERFLQLDLFVFTGEAGKPSIRVFHHEINEASPPPLLKLPVVIDDAVLRDGR